jgi:hypothetical protein
MESQAKQVTQCDNCKMTLKREEDLEGDHIQAKLKSSTGESKDYHYCSDECLRQHLNGRAKRKKTSKASIELNIPSKSKVVIIEENQCQ